MLMYGLRCPVRVLAVLAADRYSVALLDGAGRRTGDDVTVVLSDWQSPIVRRPADPPVRAWAMFGGDADAPATCPTARRHAERIVRRRGVRLEVRLPVSGRRWLRSVADGDGVPGDLFVGGGADEAMVSIGELLRPRWVLRRREVSL